MRCSQTVKGRKQLSAELGRPIGDVPWDRFENQLQLIENSDARIVCLADPDYPSYLLDISRPPPLLFSRGVTGISMTSSPR